MENSVSMLGAGGHLKHSAQRGRLISMQSDGTISLPVGVNNGQTEGGDDSNRNNILKSQR